MPFNDSPINNEPRAIGYGLAAVVLWSSVAIGFKLGLAVLEVEQLLLLGSLISWGVFVVYAWMSKQWWVSRSDIGLVVALGLVNPFAYYLILFGAYDRLPAHVAQPLNYTWAITLALLAVPLLRQPLTARMMIGIFVAYAGVVLLLVTSPANGEGTLDLIGIALALLSTVLWAGYWLLNTRSRSAPSSLMLWSFSIGTPAVALVCWFGPGFPKLTAQTLAYGVWVGLIEMGVTFILWQQALRYTRQVARIGSLIFLSPFISLVLIYVVLGEEISPWAVVALGVIVLGLRLVSPAQSRAG